MVRGANQKTCRVGEGEDRRGYEQWYMLGVCTPDDWLYLAEMKAYLAKMSRLSLWSIKDVTDECVHDGEPARRLTSSVLQFSSRVSALPPVTLFEVHKPPSQSNIRCRPIMSM